MRSRNLVVAVSCLVFGSWSALAHSKDIVDTAVEAGSFRTLAQALQAAGLVDALKGAGPFTVFAPTDEAFSKLPPEVLQGLLRPEQKDRLTSILTYHVVSGRVPASQVVQRTGAKTLNGQQVDIKVVDGTVLVDNAQVVKTDIECSNGIIHVIDQVILPSEDNIPAAAQKAGDFKTLLAAVGAAGLGDVLAGEGPFTVFAPTDAAFAKLPSGTVENLLKPENREKLTAILKYHVVPGRVYSSDAVAAGRAKTLEGREVRITVTEDTARVNDAALVATDLDASNGVIHVVDTVLLPSPEGQSQAREVKHVIAAAINQGAPLYNQGHHAACAQVYMTTVRDLLAMDNHGMCQGTVATLQRAMAQAQQTQSADSQAWTLRHALDTAYNNVGSVR